jgi:hypothetical protein
MPSPSLSKSRHREALTRVADLLQASRWQIDLAQASERHDLVLARKGTRRIAVEVKTTTEARGDRVIPLLSQALIQAEAHARRAKTPTEALAVVCVPTMSASLMKHIIAFMHEFSEGSHFGVVAEDGFRYFEGLGLETLNAEAEARGKQSVAVPRRSANLFTDHNQWLLKVLLSPEFPTDLLTGPRDRYSSNNEFAHVAGVSAMTASRFLTQLRAEGFLDDSSRVFRLVQREELFRRWRAAASRHTIGTPARFVIKAPANQQLRALVNDKGGEAWLGLFAAADALEAGHVSGVPPQVVVPRMPNFGEGTWRTVMPQTHGNVDLFVRETSTPVSTARGAVCRDGVMVTDIIQTWLDVAEHPARGAEQADLIYEEILLPIIKGPN